MFKRFSSLLLLLAMPVAHAEQIPLTIGDNTIQFPMESDYVRVSQVEPKLFAFTAAALPTTNRLVETLATRADIARMSQGGTAADIYFEVQAQREIETRQVSIDDWNGLKPELTAGMTHADMNEVLSSNTGNNDRMSAAAGQRVDLSYGKMGAPVVYRETPWSVNFAVMVPMQVRIGANAENITVAAAGSFAIVRNKLIYIYAFSTSTSPEGVAKVRARLNEVVDETVALNPSDAAVRSTGGFDWSSVGRSAMIGGIIGGIVGLFAWLVKRRKT